MAERQYLIETKYGSFYAVIVIIKKDKIFRVTVAAFPDVMTEARTLSEAKRYAREIIELQCVAALEDKKLVIDDLRQAHGKYARAGTFNVVA